MKLGAIVLDSDDSESLSDFYSKLLGWLNHRVDDEWIIVAKDRDALPALVFQQIDSYTRPVWPTEKDRQQQMLHLDFYTSDVENSVKHAISCGAVLSEVQYDKHWRVLFDPAGHPFCILPDKPPE